MHGTRYRDAGQQTVDLPPGCGQSQQKSGSAESAFSMSNPELPDYKITEEPRGTVFSERESIEHVARTVRSLDPARTNQATFGQWPDQGLSGAEVIYSYYPFVSADAIHQIVLEDLHYLERLGCYRLPSRPSLDEFVKAYFRYTHPHQPILDEGDFWRAYYARPAETHTRTFSIFVLQAMLFAACSVGISLGPDL